MAILVYGSLVPDIVYRVPRLPQRGEDVPATDVRVIAAGGGGNVALALAAWGYGVRACGNTVGTDPLGKWMEAELEELGIELPAGFVSPTGLTAPNGILVTPDGERTIVGNDYRKVEWLPVAEWDGVEAVLVDAYSAAAGSAIIDAASARSIPVVGADRTGPEVASLTVLLWSADEHPDPTEARAVAAEGTWVVVTGAGGPIELYDPDGTSARVTPRESEVKDSTGAGDVFAAAMVAGLADGKPVPVAVTRAADVAGRYVKAGRDSKMPPLGRLGP